MLLPASLCNPFSFANLLKLSAYAYALQGERIFSNYGNKSNEELIRNYGFSLERNSADFFHISFGSQSQAPGQFL